MEQPNLFVILLVLFIGIINIVVPIAIWNYNVYSIKEYMLSPNWIYENSNMNKISCYIIAILFGIINFVWSSILIIYWLTHLGRRDDFD